MRLLLVLASTLAPLAQAEPADAEAEAAARRVFADSDYQVELPTDAPPSAEPEPGRRTRGRSRTTRSSDFSEPDSSGSGLARFLWYLLVAVVLAGLVLWAVREWTDAKQRNLRVTPPRTAPDPAARPEPGLPDPARLAAAGRHAEAVHALLLHALREVHRRAGSLAPAWTSREILARVALPPGAREALEEIVRVVEASRFGGAAVGEDAYAACVRRAEACRRALPEKAA